MAANIHAASGDDQQPTTTSLHYRLRTGHPQMASDHGLRWLVDRQGHRTTSERPRAPPTTQNTTWPRNRNSTPHSWHLSAVRSHRFTTKHNAVGLTASPQQRYSRIQQLPAHLPPITPLCTPPPHQLHLGTDSFDDDDRPTQLTLPPNDLTFKQPHRRTANNEPTHHTIDHADYHLRFFTTRLHTPI